VFGPVETGFPKPDEKLRLAPGQYQGCSARFEPLPQIAKCVKASRVDLTDWNCIDHKPSKFGTCGVGHGQGP